MQPHSLLSVFCSVVAHIAFTQSLNAAAICEPRFPSVSTFGVEKNPVSVALGDLDRDGKKDIVVVNQNSGSISIFLNDGARLFKPAVIHPLQGEPSDVVIADLNADNIPDLALCGFGQFAPLWVLFGKGDGSFNAPQTYSSGSYSHSISVGDLNGDQKLDLLVASDSSQSVIASFNDGQGAFPTSIDTAAASRAFAAELADFNGDARLDIAVADFIPGSIVMRMGNGDGTFEPSTNYTGLPNPFSLVTADLNKDAKADLVVGLGETNVAVMFGDGHGAFEIKRFPVPAFPVGVATADFNNDTFLDLVTANNLNESISVLLSDKNGGFTTAVNYTAGGKPVAIAAGDLDADGFMDVVVGNSIEVTFAGTISIAWGKGDGTLDAPLSFWMDSGARALGVGNLDDDSNLDLAAVSHFGSYHLLFGEGDGRFGRKQGYGVSQFLSPALAVGDFDGVGADEVATVHFMQIFPGSQSFFLLNTHALQADGTFRPTNAYSFNQMAPPTLLGIVDLNRNNKPELAFLLPPQTLSLYFIDHAFQFRQGPSFTVGANAYSALDVDINGDNISDLLVGDEQGVLFIKSGTETPVRLTFSEPFVTLVGSGDFNQDGKSDLILSTTNSEIAVLSSQGDGSFSVGARYSVPGAHKSEAVDLNLDGKLDLAVKHLGFGFSILVGNGDGTFQQPTAYVAGYSTDSLSVGDFNSDQRPDIAVLSRGAVSVLLNTCSLPAPTLSSVWDGSKLVLSWPHANGTSLESSKSLQAPQWQAHQNSVVNDGRAQLEFEATEGMRFFRLNVQSE